MYAPVDFETDVLVDGYRLNLVEGYVFHYKGSREEPNWWTIFLAYYFDQWVVEKASRLPFTLILQLQAWLVSSLMFWISEGVAGLM